MLRLLCVLCELGVGDDRRRAYPPDETALDLPSNQPIVLVMVMLKLMLKLMLRLRLRLVTGASFRTWGQTGE